LQGPPKFSQLWIFGLKTNHLATLLGPNLFPNTDVNVFTWTAVFVVVVVVVIIIIVVVGPLERFDESGERKKHGRLKAAGQKRGGLKAAGQKQGRLKASGKNSNFIPRGHSSPLGMS
jgi:hypothetical protein